MIYAVTVYYDLGPKLGLVVRKRLTSLGIESSEARWSCSYKSISEVKCYSDWNGSGGFSFANTGSYWTRGGSYTGVVMLGRAFQFYVHIGLIAVRNILRVAHRHSGDECFPQQS